MNKKMIASVVAACVLSVGTAFASTNPFADVSPNDWSYGAVKNLAQAGLIDGYSDGTFKGDKSITRYEMAQLVGKAIYRSDKANAEQKAAIEKLATEYKDELQNLGVRMDNLEKKTAGVNDWKINGWAQTENTYGHTYGNKNLHEYNMQVRIRVQKPITDKLNVLYELKNKDYLDTASGTKDTAWRTRQSFFTYKASPDTTINIGKKVYWLANGLFMDDTVRGVDITTKLSDKLTFFGLLGRYEGNLDSTIAYGAIGGKFGNFDLGVHYMTGSKTIINKSIGTSIPAVTAGYTLPSGLNISGGYAENTKADDHNKMYKLQLWKTINKDELILQYWKQEGNLNLPAENGDHLTWWGNEYGALGGNQGFKGYRAIVVHHINPQLYTETWYGDYKNLVTNERAKKYGWDVTISF